MFNSQMPSLDDLPTSRQLLRSTALAAVAAAGLLVAVILPAEYGIDPIGTGSVLGLTPMGEMKRDQAAAAASSALTPSEDSGDLTLDETPAAPVDGPAPGAQKGEVTLTLAPDEGTEVKATMKAGSELRYEWRTNGPVVNFELHGEEIGAAASEYTSYEKGKSAAKAGTFRAPFEGTHGWFWRNRSGQPVEITVKASGAFQKFEQVKG